jgi:3'-phosphoadenosine 5'-phosphosulfate sulfotransferase (PAPS reductase)/FAD synthetase
MTAHDLFPTPEDPRKWKRASDLSGPALLRAAVDEFKPAAIYSLFSGGHDSLVATHMAMSTGLPNAVVHVDTGVGLAATAQFVFDVCRQQQWPLNILRARWLGQDYEDIVEALGGFPGPGSHGRCYNRLKERAIRSLIKNAPKQRGDLVMLVAGRRSQESARRAINVSAIERDGNRLWVSIIHDLSDADCRDYMVQHGLPRNPVKDALCMSGECLCGAFAKRNELQELVLNYPDDPTVKHLVAMSDAEEAAGRWRWDSSPHQHAKAIKIEGGELCTTCCQFAADLFDTEVAQ